MKILVGIPTRGMVSVDWALSLATLQIPAGATVRRQAIDGAPLDHMRNDLVKMALRDGYDYLLFNDDDTRIPEHGLIQLLSRDLHIVSGLYYNRHEPFGPLAFNEANGRRYQPADLPLGQLVPVDYVGAGCLLLKRTVLERLEYPWFKWTAHDEDLPDTDRMSEDLYFCRKARENGLVVHLDTSVRCLHMGLGKAEVGGSFVPASSVTDRAHFGVCPAGNPAVVAAR